MGESEVGRVFLENVYDAMIDKATLDVQQSFHSPNANDFWNDLHKLAIIIRDPAEAHDKFIQFIRQIEREMEVKKARKGLTVAQSFFMNQDNNNWLRGKGLELMDMEWAALQKSGYFTRRARRIQSNVAKGQLFETR